MKEKKFGEQKKELKKKRKNNFFQDVSGHKRDVGVVVAVDKRY